MFFNKVYYSFFFCNKRCYLLRVANEVSISRRIYRTSDVSFASPWVDLRGTDLNPRGHGTVLVFPFFPAEKHVVYYRKRPRWTTGTYPRDLVEFWSAVYRSRPNFFRVI